jgi:hypothetical protein
MGLASAGLISLTPSFGKTSNLIGFRIDTEAKSRTGRLEITGAIT